MTSIYQLPDSSQCAIPVLMGKDRNVTFILDTSESMTAILGTVKNLIIQTLLVKASLRNSLFNIITFSYKVTPWSDHMIPCAPDTVYEALGWMHTIRTSPGKDLLTAFTAAFSDPACQSIHLVTNSLPDNPEKCLSALSACGTRPVHTFHIGEKQSLDTDTLDFLKCLTSATRGICYRLALNSGGTGEQVALLHSAELQIQEASFSEDRCCQALYYNTMKADCLSPHWCSHRNPLSSAPCISSRVMRGAEFFPGCRVLARREVDGFYYMGTIVHQLQDRGSLFMVAYGTSEMAPPQPTCQQDMISITQGYGHSIVPGDTVLAPFDPQMSRYGPGRVVSGMELRDPLKGGAGNGLLVLFWNGFRTHIPNDLAVWIPASHHEQIIRDFQSRAFRPSCCFTHPHCSHVNWTPACCVHQCLSAAPALCRCLIKSRLPLTSSFLSNQENEKLEISADQLKGFQSSQETQIPSPTPSSSSSSDDEEKNEKMKATGLELVSRSVNTEISCLKKACAVAQSKPAWRYWRRAVPEPHHRQPGREARTPNVRYSWPGKLRLPAYLSSNTAANNSSLFELVPESVRRGTTVRDTFDWTKQPASEGVSPLAYALSKISFNQPNK